jgi:hypothetical protein
MEEQKIKSLEDPDPLPEKSQSEKLKKISDFYLQKNKSNNILDPFEKIKSEGNYEDYQE